MYRPLPPLVPGVAALLGSISPWAAPVAFFGLAANWYIPFEERACSERFGVAYDAYRAQTRRWM